METKSIQVFNNTEFGEIRSMTIDGEPYFVGKDVAAALGYSNPRKAIGDHVDEEDKGVTKGDDIYDINNALKANPLYVGKPEQIEILKTEAETARNMGGSDRVDYITKSVNLWTNSDDANYVNADDLHACLTEKELSAFDGRDCWVGLDLSSGGDLTSWAIEFEDKGKIFLHAHSYIPYGRLRF